MGKLISSLHKKLFKNKSICRDIAFISGVLTLITALFLTGYHLNGAYNVLGYIDNIKKEKQQVITSAVNIYLDQHFGNNKMNDITKTKFILTINRLVNDGAIASIKINDKTSGEELISTPIIYKPGLKRYSYFYNNYDVLIYFYSDNAIYNVMKSSVKWSIFVTLGVIIIGCILAFTTARYIIRPIKKLANGAEEFARGNLKYEIESSGYTELNRLIQAFNVMAKELRELYEDLENQVQDRTRELKEAQVALVHNEKMKSLGRMVAGITHEISNPINFIYGNMTHLEEYSNSLIKLINTYDAKKSDEEIKKLKEEIEYDYLADDIFDLIKSCKEGSERAKGIIFDLKKFSRFEKPSVAMVSVENEIDMTLNILHNKYKYDIKVHKDYTELPKIKSFGGQLNQVFMNILDNAAYAIEKNGSKGDVWIKTFKENDNVIIEIEDNGTGISKDNLDKIFDPFFTTKTVGEGTGLGMSISYKIIKNHKGDIEIKSEEGKGTKFTIRIPEDFELSEATDGAMQ